MPNWIFSTVPKSTSSFELKQHVSKPWQILGHHSRNKTKTPNKHKVGECLTAQGHGDCHETNNGGDPSQLLLSQASERGMESLFPEGSGRGCSPWLCWSFPWGPPAAARCEGSQDSPSGGRSSPRGRCALHGVAAPVPCPRPPQTRQSGQGTGSQPPR